MAADCTIAQRSIIEKLTTPISQEEQKLSQVFFHTVVSEPDPTLVGSSILAFMNFGDKLDVFDNWYVEEFQTYKPAHGWNPLEQLHTPLDKRHTQVKLGHRKQKCRIAYSSSMSIYPRGKRFFENEEQWNKQLRANFKAFVFALKMYDCYKILKIFNGKKDNVKKILGENHKCNYLADIIDQHESKTNEGEDFQMYHLSLQQRYNNAKDASAIPGGVHVDRPMCIKADGTCCATSQDCEVFKIKENLNRDILEVVCCLVNCNKATATKLTGKTVEQILDEKDLKYLGMIQKVMDICKSVTTEPTTQYNLCHNAQDVTKCCSDSDCNDLCGISNLKEKVKALKKHGVHFMGCCCCLDENATTCFCELPVIRQASELRLIINPMTARELRALQLISVNYQLYDLKPENFNGVQIIEDLAYPKDQIHIVEKGFVEFKERYNEQNEGKFETPDLLMNTTRHVEQEIVTRFNKVCVVVKCPT